MRIRQLAKTGLVLALCTSLLLACDSYPTHSKNNELSDMQDRQQELTRQDYRNLNKVKKLLDADKAAQAQAAVGVPPIPDLAQVLAAPRPPKIANTKLVTLAVTDDVPLRDVLFELGRLANVDIEVGTGLDQQGINLRATDRPFNEVIERIADLGNLRYSVKGNSIRVERDLPYIKNYNLDFINVVRSSSSSYTLSTSILSAGSGGGSSSSSSSSSGSGGGSSTGGVGNSGSSTSIASQAESDLWASLEASITEILNYLPQGGNAAQGSAASLTADTATAAAGAGSAANAAETAGATPAGGSTAAAGFVINRQAGILSVNATERQHEMIKRFLDLLGRNASAQVLIEAKIVEVSLSEQFLSGVDWQKIIGNVEGIYFSPGDHIPAGISGSTAGVFGIDGMGLNAAVSLTEQFGTTRTLSSPRLNAINNQQAVLTFARNEVFFDCQVEAPTTTTGDNPLQTQPVPDCSPSSVPIGIILNILPSINLDTQEVTLSVRPTLTRKVGDAINPETNYINSLGDGSGTPITISTPIIEVREIDSIMKVKSGGIMVIGGLLEDTTTTQNQGIPGLSEVPFLGNAFKSRDEDYGKRELIIFIKASIVNTDGSTHPVDRAVYDRYTTDPRPLFPKKEDAQ